MEVHAGRCIADAVPGKAEERARLHREVVCVRADGTVGDRQEPRVLGLVAGRINCGNAGSEVRRCACEAGGGRACAAASDCASLEVVTDRCRSAGVVRLHVAVGVVSRRRRMEGDTGRLGGEVAPLEGGERARIDIEVAAVRHDSRSTGVHDRKVHSGLGLVRGNGGRRRAAGEDECSAVVRQAGLGPARSGSAGLATTG